MQSGAYGTYYTSNVSLSPEEQKVNAAYIYRWLMEHGWAMMRKRQKRAKKKGDAKHTQHF